MKCMELKYKPNMGELTADVNEIIQQVRVRVTLT